MAAIHPQAGVADSGIVAVGRQAFRKQRCIYRKARDAGELASGQATVYVGLSLRIGGRPAVVAMKLAAPATASDAAVLASVAPLVLRRADDRAATTTFASTAQRVVTPLAARRRRTSGAGAGQQDPLAPVKAPAATHSAKRPAPGTGTVPPTRSAPRRAVTPDAGAAAAAAAAAAPAAGAAPAAAAAPAAVAVPAAMAAPVAPATGPADPAAALARRQGTVLQGVATVLDQQGLAPSLHALCEGVAQVLHCLRVTVAVVRSRRLVVEAVSGTADFDRRSALIVDITQALEETRSCAAAIVMPAPDGDPAPPQNHVALAEQLRNPALMSLPLVDGGEIVGALLLERDREFSAEEQALVRQISLLVAPIIALKQVEAMGPLDWLGRFARRQARAVLSASHLGPKLGAVAVLVLLVFSGLYQQPFRIDADASIQADVERAVVASFPSYLREVSKRAGDLVQQGDVLARLDVEDLELDRIRWVGEYEKLSKEYRATLAQRDRSNFRVIQARRDQAQAQIDLIDTQMARATLRAPIDGVVISGDLSQSIGSPVERGELLFEVASLEGYRLALMVDESDIGWVEAGRTGRLRLRSLPEQSFPFTVTAITPVSEPGRGVNRFRVEATLDEAPTSLRPGMNGAAKIDIEPRPIGWIWIHDFVDWLRYQIWKHGF